MKKHLAFAIALCIAGIGAAAQNTLRIVPGKAGMYPAYVSFPSGMEPMFVPGTVYLQKQDELIPTSATVFVHSEPDQLGQVHFRYQQKINDIPVEGAVYVMHVTDGKVMSMNGDFIADIPASLSSLPVITETQALQSAKNAFGAKVYKWELNTEEAFIKRESGRSDATFLPKGELVYYSGERAVSGRNLHLAWKLDLYAHEPMGRRIYFIDAVTGAVLGNRELIHTTNATGTAVTGYSGTQTITTDLSSNTYRLSETGRGNGIATYNLAQSSAYSGATNFTDADNYWNNANTALDQYATDAHWGAEKTYDYYKNIYNRNSIDNAGYAINSYVHYSTGYFNAFWDGTRMTYGDGGSIDNNLPLTSLDVCAHEITHGLTANTAGLYYSYESGALNEGFSDIFGTTIEYYAAPTTANWTMGEAFYTVRSLSSPGDYGQPTTYLGANWSTASYDNGGVHTNSGVLNYWYYLLTVGGSGTNDNSYNYSVTGIGMTKAAAIAYRTLTVYLTGTSQYTDARTYSIQAATDLYGASSNEVTQVINAWNAVGVAGTSSSSSSSTTTTTTTTPPPPVTPTCTDTYEPNESRTLSKSIAVNTDITARIGTSTDKDWFVFTTSNAAPKLRVTLTNLPANYDIRLYKSNGSQIGISQNTGVTSEGISYNSTNFGNTYYVQVYGVNGANNSGSCYTLRVTTGSTNQFAAGGGAEDEGATLTNDSPDELSVFPNPTKDKLNLSFSSDENGSANVIITDITGRTLLTQAAEILEGTNTLSLSLAGYQPGIYFVHIPGKKAARFEIAH